MVSGAGPALAAAQGAVAQQRVRRRSRSTWRCSPPRGPTSASGRPRPPICARAPPPARSRELRRGRAIIAILREPASFLRSLHLQIVQNHVETESDLRRALALEDDAPRRARDPARLPRPQALLYSDHVRYVEQLRRYHELFGREQVLVLIYDDFRATTRRPCAACCASWKSTSWRRSSWSRPTRPSPCARCACTAPCRPCRWAAGRVAEAVKASLKTLTSRRLRHAGLRAVRRGVVYGAPPPPDEELMAELRRRFAPEVVALSEYLERDLVRLWGYDGLA